MSRAKPRKDPKTIIDQIYRELEEGGTKTTNQVAVRMRANTQTIKHWVDLIKYVQAKPKLVVESGDRITLVRIEKES